MLTITALIKQLFYLIATLVVAWILVHFIAVFGLFFAAAIPVLHLFFYPHILCFWCRLKGGKHNFSHSLIDATLMLVLTLGSIGVVYGETILLNRLGIITAEKSVSFILPKKNQYKLGEIFSMPIKVAGIKSPVNVIQADLTFDPTILEVVDINLEDSFVTIIVQKEFNNDLGYVRLAAGLPNPGFQGNEGHLATVYFRGKRSGPVEVQFADSSLVLANDGHGTNVLKDLSRTDYLIETERVKEEEELRQKEIIIKKQVLGDQASVNQLDYTGYQNELPKPFAGILGETTPSAPNLPAPKPSFFAQIVASLSRLDAQIITFWQTLFSR